VTSAGPRCTPPACSNTGSWAVCVRLDASASPHRPAARHGDG